jgi:syndecan 1
VLLARAAGIGRAPATPSYRIAPLLGVRRLARPVVTSNAQPKHVAPAVWRRPGHAVPTVRLAEPPSGAAGQGVDIVAMEPPRPATLPVTRVQRAELTTTRPRSVSAPPALESVRTTTAVKPPPEKSEPPPKPDPLAGIEMDKLARQLFEPISRLLRADLRRGRERAGFGQDHRR